MINNIKRIILQKLIRANMWGGKHTPLDFIEKGLPEHFRVTHKGRKIIEKAFKGMLNNGWIVLTLKKTHKSSDAHISLNP
jgi:hypothetical protein